MTTGARAGSPIDLVTVAGLVTVAKDLISSDEVSRIILLVDLEVVRADEGNYPYHPC